MTLSRHIRPPCYDRSHVYCLNRPSYDNYPILICFIVNMAGQCSIMVFFSPTDCNYNYKLATINGPVCTICWPSLFSMMGNPSISICLSLF